MMGVKDSWRPTVSFVDCGTVAEVFARNTRTLNTRISSLTDEIARHEKSIASARLSLAAETKTTGDIMSAIMLGMSTGENDEEEQSDA